MSSLPEVNVGESPDFRESDFREAQLLQKSLLPRDYLRTPAFEISFRYRTFVDVGGDFLDYFYLDDRQLGLYLGDVVGKGLTAAMYATLCMGTLRMIHKTGEQPSAVLRAFNRRLRARPVANRFCVTEYVCSTPKPWNFAWPTPGFRFHYIFLPTAVALWEWGDCLRDSSITPNTNNIVCNCLLETPSCLLRTVSTKHLPRMAGNSGWTG